MYPGYAVEIEKNSQAQDFIEQVINQALLGDTAARAAGRLLKAIARGGFPGGLPINLREQAVTLKQLRANSDMHWYLPSAIYLVHPLGIDAGLDEATRAAAKAWREEHVWLFGIAGFAGRGPRPLDGWGFLVAMAEVNGFMSGQRPQAPRAEPRPPVRICGMLDMGFR